MKNPITYMNRISSRAETLNIYPWSAALLTGTAIILLIIALATDRGDMTTSMLIVISLALFLIAVMMVTFTRVEGLDPLYAAAFYPTQSINNTRILSDLGVYGDAHFIPEIKNARALIQFNPASVFTGHEYRDNSCFVISDDHPGIISDPSCTSLMELLKERHSLQIPLNTEGGDTLIQQIMGEALVECMGVAGRVTIKKAGEDTIVDLEGFSLISGCRTVRNESPKCCTVSPCPVCSIIAGIYAEMRGEIVKIVEANPDYEKQILSIILSRVPSYQPKDEGHGSLR